MLGIGIGSRTSTGGVVIEGNASILFDGLIASSVGQKATCPACKTGVGPIVAVGGREVLLPAGPAARAGDYVACGCPTGSNVLLPNSTIRIGSEHANVGVLASTSLTGSAQNTQTADTRHDSEDVLHAASPDADARTICINEPPEQQTASEQLDYKWELSSRDYFIRQVAYLPAEGVGVNGSFFIRGSLALNGRKLFLSAMGFTAAKRMGKVHFSASAIVELNGKELFSGPLQHGDGAGMWPVDEYSPIGSVVIELPAAQQEDQASITIRGSYIYSAPEGNAVPIPPRGAVTLPLTATEAL